MGLCILNIIYSIIRRLQNRAYTAPTTACGRDIQTPSIQFLFFRKTVCHHRHHPLSILLLPSRRRRLRRRRRHHHHHRQFQHHLLILHRDHHQQKISYYFYVKISSLKASSHTCTSPMTSVLPQASESARIQSPIHAFISNQHRPIVPGITMSCIIILSIGQPKWRRTCIYHRVHCASQ